MGVIYARREGDELWGRSLMSSGHRSGALFFEIAKLLESRVGLPCGILDETFADFYVVLPGEYLPFIDAFFDVNWTGQRVGHLYNWAEYAVGMVENLTLEPWLSNRGKGPALLPVRYHIGGEIDAELSRKKKELLDKGVYPAQHQPAYTMLQLDEYRSLIEGSDVKIAS